MHLREGEAVLVEVTITSGVNKMLLRNSIKNPEEPHNYRFKAKTRQYAKSASTKDRMSAIVPFVVSAHGRLHTGGARLLDKIARCGFGTNLSAAGRWKSKWYARLVEATLTRAAWQLRGEYDRLKARVLKQRARAARADGGMLHEGLECPLKRCLSDSFDPVMEHPPARLTLPVLGSPRGAFSQHDQPAPPPPPVAAHCLGQIRARVVAQPDDSGTASASAKQRVAASLVDVVSSQVKTRKTPS